MTRSACGSLRVLATPRGLFTRKYRNSWAVTGSPRTATTSSGATFWRGNVTTSSFTVTAPSRMSSSQERREPTPARAR